ncbi:MAG: UDP-3-O-(3-hydroxymyristoyl)glucosamine N-acyltransferase [Methylotenera sp.]|uniref:UDP-3-O-(3-hydroxymyristoyl)glucosamine N-acyltransferase n=1 Tax=Methylotenera sp. TaxID=2051956 RepID=UPI000D4766E6|nr:UDP-3-O-(3-hydroxymyristoyl)glucosamine N-acyltransferase [Methylotenera sp.]PPC82402.1 MAG: UDP-3-O-(3-hydroxymyristoyl)glucosamine N-acyltransferase [Methylotenera sp.]
MSQQYSLNDIVSALGGHVVGDGDVLISRVSSIANALSGSISFFNDTKYQKALAASRASAFIMKDAHAGLTAQPKIIVDNPYAYFAKLSAFLNPLATAPIGVHETAVIHASAQIPASCSIGPQVVIGENVTLGEHVVITSGCVVENDVKIAAGSRLEPNVVIKHHCEIGENCHIFSGVVIGSDGFGYAEEAGKWLKIPQVGRVVIHANVDIGANTTVDRGAIDDTIIEEGVKLDNLIQIGHNCVIGAHTVIAGCVGVAGSARIGKHCKIGGAAMILGHLEIADHVTISPGSMITRSLTAADTYTALMPFQTHKAWLNTAAKIRHLDDFAAKIKQLENEISLLKAK